MITTKALLTEAELAEGFLAAFAARSLPEKFFYWFPLSVRAWLDLCSDGEYRNYVRSRSLIARSAAELSEVLGAGQRDVFSIGSGQGDKDLILAGAMAANSTKIRYIPVDTSQALLEMACGRALGSDIESWAIKADFTVAAHLAALTPTSDEPPRLVMLVGNTLGCTDPLRFAADLAGLLRSEDLLLVDGELFSEGAIAGYDNPINRRFAWAPLHSVGIGDEDGDIAFVGEQDSRIDGLHLISKHFAPRRRVEVALSGESFALAEGEQLEMSHSYKYSMSAFGSVLAQAGLKIEWQATSDDERFVMALAARG